MNFSQLPHKNLIMSGVVALAIIAIGLYVNHNPSTQEIKLSTQNIPLSTTTPSMDIAERDTDLDLLPDWEERLYGSDPFKKDTDGDGTEDGAELADGRDPATANTAKAGKEPSDKVAAIQDPHFATSSTDILGIKKDYFAKFLAEQGKEIRETTFRNLIKGIDMTKYKSRTQLVDLNVSSDNSNDAMRAYGNAFGLLIKKYTVRAHRTEEEIVAAALPKKDTVILKELQLPAITYRNFANDLRVLKVPSLLVEHHLLIVNGYEGMSKGLLGMQTLFTNTIDGAGGYQAYTVSKIDVTKGYAGIVSVFSKNKVEFARDEPGAPFYFKPTHASSTTKNL